jgi:acyl-CoA reductase-like NAD-dependent aldehyde dehydrogenase
MSKGREPLRLDVRTTLRPFVDGEFLRSDDERSEPVAGDESVRAVRVSRNDVRAAIAAAKRAFGPWAASAAAERARTLYRLAEALDARRADLIERLKSTSKPDDADAAREADTAVERALWYAGSADKFQSVLSAVSPVAAPFTVASARGPLGVVVAIAPDQPALLGLTVAALPALAAGNTVVALASETAPRCAGIFAECIAAARLPNGTLNVLTGRRIEVGPQAARDADVAGLCAYGLDAPFAAELARMAADDFKQCRLLAAPSQAEWYADDAPSLDDLAAFTAVRTIWQPALI